MEYILTGQEMKELDTYAIESIKIPSVVLMERAAQAVAAFVKELAKKSVLVVCGTGNNGADGLAVCRMLAIEGVSCAYTVVGNREKATEEFRLQQQILDNLQIAETVADSYAGYEVIVDALFGVGLKREVQGAFAESVERINQSHAYVVSVDVPSGINADNGAVCGCAVQADATVTFGYRKNGLVLYPGKTYAGHIVVADIGYPKHLCGVLGIGNPCMGDEDVRRIPARSQSGNKGNFGKILIVAGSEKYCGAAVLAARAAYRMGAGMVKVVTHEKNRDVICGQIPEVLTLFYKDTWSEEVERELAQSVVWADVAVVGPGLSTGQMAKQLLETVYAHLEHKRIVVDADALNLMAGDETLLALLGENSVITPHQMEFSRLTGVAVAEIKREPERYAREFALQHCCQVVLKDAVTVVTDGESCYYNLSGNSGMATAGSGDVLAGMLGAACVWKLPLVQVAALAVYIHGRAGDMAAEQSGESAVMASDLTEGLKYLDRKLRG